MGLLLVLSLLREVFLRVLRVLVTNTPLNIIAAFVVGEGGWLLWEHYTLVIFLDANEGIITY